MVKWTRHLKRSPVIEVTDQDLKEAECTTANLDVLKISLDAVELDRSLLQNGNQILWLRMKTETVEVKFIYSLIKNVVLSCLENVADYSLLISESYEVLIIKSENRQKQTREKQIKKPVKRELMRSIISYFIKHHVVSMLWIAAFAISNLGCSLVKSSSSVSR
jgi:hypothetical protein